MILRNQTASVVSRHQNVPNRRTQNSNTSSIKEFRFATQEMPSPILRYHSQSLELHALTVLFTSSTLMSKTDIRLSHGHLDSLQCLHQRVTSDSALALATSWLAVLAMGFHDKDRSYYTEESQLMSRAIQHTLDAIKDPVQSVRNETLAAVVLLAYGEHLRNGTRRARGRTFIIHQDGAEALIRKRKDLNFQDNTSISLFNAVRHNALNLALSGVRSAGKNWDLWVLDDNIHELCDYYTPATELDACGVMMLSLQYDLASADFSAYANLQTKMSQLLERLRSWPNRVPGEWFSRTTITTTSKPEKNQSQKVCYLFNQWYLLQLAAGHLLKELDLRTKISEICASDFSGELNCIDNIMSSKPLLLGIEESGVNIAASPSVVDAWPREDNVSAVDGESYQGLRLFNQTVRKLDLIISNALRGLILPSTINMCYRGVLSWAREGRRD